MVFLRFTIISDSRSASRPITVITPRTTLAMSDGHLLSSVRIQQLAGHLVKEFRVVQHFFYFFLGAAVIQECLHLVAVTPNAFATLNRSS